MRVNIQKRGKVYQYRIEIVKINGTRKILNKSGFRTKKEAEIAGQKAMDDYLNGDVVINNTALYCVRNYSGELKWDSESKNMKFFDLDNLPENQNDPDLIEIYIKKLNRKTR